MLKEDIEAVVDRNYIFCRKKSITVLLFNLQMVKSKQKYVFFALGKGRRYSTLCNLVRLSRGEMIGVKFNKDKDWVGGTIGLFER
jgi:hypothetical protein